MANNQCLSTCVFPHTLRISDFTNEGKIKCNKNIIAANITLALAVLLYLLVQNVTDLLVVEYPR